MACVIGITTGNRDGIGLEVTLKALREFFRRRGGRGAKDIRFLVFCGDDAATARLVKRSRLRPKQAIFVRSSGNEAAWFEEAVLAAGEDRYGLDAVVTGPVSKDRFLQLKSAKRGRGAKPIGHNGLLEQMTGVRPTQGYVAQLSRSTKAGESLAVVLATDHIPLAQVESELTPKTLTLALARAKILRAALPTAMKKKPIAVIGLNPHAGEGGLLGKFEKRRLIPWLRRSGRGVIGPLPPDTAFSPAVRTKYSVAIALYHDQGLIPFKTLYGQDAGFQVSLGLPFVRTSVDHGTATDIAGKNQAQHESMLAAIDGALALLKLQKARKR